MQNSKKRPTQADVARQAKVSSAVVSAVVSRKPGKNIRVSDDTRLRVERAIKELGYVPNIAAQSLANGQKNIIGLFSFESVFPKDSNDFFRDFLLGVESAAESMGYDLMLYTASSGLKKKKSIYEGGVNRLAMSDGAILFGRDPNPKELIKLQKEGYRFVYIGRQSLSTPISYVAADYTSATYELAKHMSKLGHRNFRYIGEKPLVERRIDRENGFLNFLAEVGESSNGLVERMDTNEPLDPLLDEIQSEGVTALLVEETSVAERIYLELQRRGLQVPKDVSIAILGEADGATNPSINWSGFDVPKVKLGQQAFVSLIQMIESDLTNSRIQLTLPCEARIGDTVGDAPQ